MRCGSQGGALEIPAGFGSRGVERVAAVEEDGGVEEVEGVKEYAKGDCGSYLRCGLAASGFLDFLDSLDSQIPQGFPGLSPGGLVVPQCFDRRDASRTAGRHETRHQRDGQQPKSARAEDERVGAADTEEQVRQQSRECEGAR
jgi:hypothetical protein